MKTWMTRSLAVAAAAAVVGAGAGISAAASPGDAFGAPANASAVVSSATAADASLTQLLRFGSEEERMARDLYTAFAARYGDETPFSRIATSEQRHLDAMATLLTRYAVADPAAGKTAGTYADATIQTLYDRWLAQGNASLAAAYQVGIALEQRDIADLKTAVTKTTAADVRQVLANLQRASEHHLAAFQTAAAGGTVTGPGGGMGPGAKGGGPADGIMGRGMGGGMGARLGATGPDGTCPRLDAAS